MSQNEPIERRRGMDRDWWEERGHWTAVQVEADCDAVVDTFTARGSVQPQVYDAFDPSVTFGDQWPQVIFIYQLRGHDWTLLDSIGGRLTWDLAEKFSKWLETRTLIHAYENTGGVYGYGLWEKGRVVEEFSWGDTPEFDDSNREERIAEGWQLSDDNHRQLRSERLQNVDMNAPETFEIPIQTAHHLGLYIPCDVWQVESDKGQVALSSAWSKQDIQNAKFVLSTW